MSCMRERAFLRELGTIMTCFTSFVNPIISLIINALVSSTNFSQTKKTKTKKKQKQERKGSLIFQRRGMLCSDLPKVSMH